MKTLGLQLLHLASRHIVTAMQNLWSWPHLMGYSTQRASLSSMLFLCCIWSCRVSHEGEPLLLHDAVLLCGHVLASQPYWRCAVQITVNFSCIKNSSVSCFIYKAFIAGGVRAASMLVSATSSNAILGGQQLAQAVNVSCRLQLAVLALWNLSLYTCAWYSRWHAVICIHGDVYSLVSNTCSSFAAWRSSAEQLSHALWADPLLSTYWL